MSWTGKDIEKLIGAADFSAETDLKQRLLKEIISVRKISFTELGERAGKLAAEPDKKIRAPKRHVREKPGIRLDGVMKNDVPIVPNRM